MKFIVTRDPASLKDLRCGCGKPAEVAWYLPARKPEPQKLSKVKLPPPVEPQPMLYGRSCEEHIPPGVL